MHAALTVTVILIVYLRLERVACLWEYKQLLLALMLVTMFFSYSLYPPQIIAGFGSNFASSRSSVVCCPHEMIFVL